MTNNKQIKSPVRIFEVWCKGCNICVTYCPKDVLAMSHHGKAYVANPERCIQCGLCELLCPDFAITVTPRTKKPAADGKETEKPKDKPAAAGSAPGPRKVKKPTPSSGASTPKTATPRPQTKKAAAPGRSSKEGDGGR